MRTMIDLAGSRPSGPLHVITTPTSVDCSRQVRYRRSFRNLMDCIVPACCAFHDHDPDNHPADPISTDTVTCTFFGHRKGRVSFCIQDHSRPHGPPLLLLEFAVPTAYLAREMEHGLLRIALECNIKELAPRPQSMYEVPLWYMYCNGRKAGFAVRRQMTAADAAVLKKMQSVSVGAGVLPDGELMYLRARFDRVVGSADSESFHMINPAGSSGQELSVFLLR